MTKEQILTEIRNAAKQAGGRIGFKAFRKLTGIPEKQVTGKHWPSWNQALQEAGIDTVCFTKASTDEGKVFEAFAQLTARLGKWPVENELTMERHQNPSFPSMQVLRRFRKAPDFAKRLADHCKGSPELSLTEMLANERASSMPSNAPIYERAPVQGYVYMMRTGRRYKIGHTNSPTRRHREVKLDLPDPTTLVHSIETDDPSGIEAYWHNRFKDKRIRDTEFFELDAVDVAAFKRRKYQ